MILIDPEAPALAVLVHGAGHDREVWTHTVACWPTESPWHPLSLDLPGHGAQGKAMAATCVEDMAAALLLQLPARISRVAWIGHSLGALVALEAAAQMVRTHGLTPSALVLVGAGLPMRVAPALLDEAAQSPHDAIARMARASHAREAAADAPEAHAQRITQTVEWMQHAVRARPEALALDLRACDRCEADEAAATVSAAGTRTHLIHGERDRMVSAEQVDRLQALLQARKDMLDRCGHNLMSDDPPAWRHALHQALSISGG